MRRAFWGPVLLALLALLLAGCGAFAGYEAGGTETAPVHAATAASVVEPGTYSSPGEVALYLRLYGHLPANYITKSEAFSLGWESEKGNLWDVAEGKSIGGDLFGNREGRLPGAEGRVWRECDVNYSGGYRGGERIVYSNDGLIYYTADHYETFIRLYGGENP